MKTRSRVAGWLYKNRSKGIPNLMLWIAIGNAIVYLATTISTNGALIYELLNFNASLVLRGQVWRIVTFLFTYLVDMQGLGLLLGAISLLFYYFLGKVLEEYWGTLRFNLFYFSGALIGAAVSLLVQGVFLLTGRSADVVTMTATFVNLSIFLAVATIQPDAQVRIFFVLPVKMKWLALIDLAISLVSVIVGLIDMVLSLTKGTVTLSWLFPIAALANYFIFFGKDCAALLPDKWRYRRPKAQTVKQKAKPNPHWADKYRSADGRRPYRFKCTVCGRTDTEHPNLEFRYCSRCAGYRCYCADHINNHAHITE